MKAFDGVRGLISNVGMAMHDAFDFITELKCAQMECLSNVEFDRRTSHVYAAMHKDSLEPLRRSK